MKNLIQMKAKLRFFKAAVIKLCSIFALVSVVLDAGAQRQFDEAGVFLGAGYYNGEINPAMPFYKPKLAVGLSIRHCFNERLAASFQASRCKLEGADADFSDDYRKQRNAKFENETAELSFSCEYNFLPFIKGSERNFFTPYVSAGLGVCIASFPGQGLRACIPFGAGVKFAPNRRFTIALEWRYRRLFSDMLDQIGEDVYSAEFGSAAKQKSFLCNDDWYAFVGVILSVQLSGGHLKCSAYK